MIDDLIGDDISSARFANGLDARFQQMTSHDNRGIESQHLVRGLSLLDATMIVVGSMIGSGIFIVSAESSRLVGTPGWLLVAWALAGVLTITGALSCAELAAMMPRARRTEDLLAFFSDGRCSW